MSGLAYTCPHCAGETLVASEHAGGKVICPHCSQEFFASPPENSLAPQVTAPPAKVPFFKSSRLKMLQEKLEELTADGEFSTEDARSLFYEATRLKLDQQDLDALRIKATANALSAIKKRAEETWHVTDEDMERIEEVGRAFGMQMELDDNMRAWRWIYAMEVKGALPSPVPDVAFLVEDGETVYHRRGTAWAQLRVHRKGYAGTSVSIPSGIKGVRFRVGNLAPIQSEELTQLASGILWVTNQRLFFDGDRRNATVKLSKIVSLDVYQDALEIGKATGKSDYFLMDALHARWIKALILALRG